MTELKAYDNPELHELLLEYEAANVDPVKVLRKAREELGIKEFEDQS